MTGSTLELQRTVQHEASRQHLSVVPSIMQFMVRYPWLALMVILSRHTPSQSLLPFADVINMCCLLIALCLMN